MNLKPILILHLLAFAVFLLPKSSFAQIKIFSNENVVIGPWGGSAPPTNLHLSGSAYFSCLPANSGFTFENYSGDPIIRPQWGSTMWLGNNNYPLRKVYSAEVWTLTGGTFQYSDQRLKTNIKAFESDALSTIGDINIYTYDYSSDAFKNVSPEKLAELVNNSKGNTGVMAQELQQVYPQAVEYDESADVYGVDYTSLIPLMIEGMKQQQALIEELKTRVIELENE